MLIRSLFAVALVSGTIQAQATPVAGLDPKRLRLTTDSLEVYLVREGERYRSGTIVDALDTVRVNGELRLQRIYRRTDVALGNGVDTLVDAFADLTLRLVDSRSDDGGVEHVEWENGRLVGAVEQSGKSTREIDTTVTRGVYSSASFDLILQAAPLADGYRVAISAFSGRRGARTVSAKVAASEKLPGFGATWRVEADLGGRRATFWITKDSRRLVRQAVHVTPALDILILASR
ncbi:MAG TPA: hypothetical protein VL308_21150 [Gemmatimonadaceae bacterium]|nr:hypothetical protein [Gemmatimonadaceae bacterium]